MDLKLKGKSALVTGSTAGIGYAIAQSFASEGARVYVNGRTPERVDKAVAEIRQHARQSRIEGIVADLGTAAGAEAVIAKLPEVDVLVNNVGIFEPKAFVEIPDADWMRFFEVNVMSGVRLSRHYLPAMLRKNWGRVIFISSESAVQIPAEMVHYGMTKTTQIAVARGIAESVAGTGVTANSVLAGPTASEGVAGFVEDMAKHQKKSKEEIERDFFAHVPESCAQFFDNDRLRQGSWRLSIQLRKDGAGRFSPARGHGHFGESDCRLLRSGAQLLHGFGNKLVQRHRASAASRRPGLPGGSVKVGRHIGRYEFDDTDCGIPQLVPQGDGEGVDCCFGRAVHGDDGHWHKS